MMRFLIDANLPRALKAALESSGHEAADVRDVLPMDADDRTIADLARRERLCLITLDFDFADIRSYPPGDFAGIIVLATAPSASYRSIIDQVMRFVNDEALLGQAPGALAIVDPASARIRRG